MDIAAKKQPVRCDAGGRSQVRNNVGRLEGGYCVASRHCTSPAVGPDEPPAELCLAATLRDRCEDAPALVLEGRDIEMATSVELDGDAVILLAPGEIHVRGRWHLNMIVPRLRLIELIAKP